MEKSNKITIDVVVVTYNRADPFFRHALVSICNQTYQDFTIKVLDNGSTDNTKEVYDEIVSQYPNRKFEYKRLDKNHIDDYFIEEKNKMITADYVIVFHDDDLMHPNYIEYAMDIIKNTPDIAILGCKTKVSYTPEKLIWDTPTNKCRIGTTKDMVKWYCVGDSFAFPSVVYKAELYKQTRFQDDLYGSRGDFPFLIDVSKNHQVCLMETRFLHYRIHQNQTASTLLPAKDKFINLYKKMAETLLGEGKEYEKAFYDRMKCDCTNLRFISFQDAFKNGLITSGMRNEHICYILSCYAKCAFFYVLKHLSFGNVRSIAKSERNKYLEKISRTPKLLYNICENTIFDATSQMHVIVSGKEENFIEVKETKAFNNKKIYIYISGTNNSVHIENACIMDDVNIKITGNNNKVIIRSEKIGKELEILVPKSNCFVEIKNGFIGGLSIKQCCDFSSLEIEEGHTIFSGCTIYSGHADQGPACGETEHSKRQVIGRNVTLTDNCVILNNSSIRDGVFVKPGTTITNDV